MPRTKDQSRRRRIDHNPLSSGFCDLIELCVEIFWMLLCRAVLRVCAIAIQNSQPKIPNRSGSRLNVTKTAG